MKAPNSMMLKRFKYMKKITQNFPTRKSVHLNVPTDQILFSADPYKNVTLAF